MRDIRHPLFEFMPYGAPELLAAGPRHLSRALVASILLWSLVSLLATSLAARFVSSPTPTPVIWPFDHDPVNVKYEIPKLPDRPPRTEIAPARPWVDNAPIEPVREEVIVPSEAPMAPPGSGLETTTAGTEAIRPPVSQAAEVEPDRGEVVDVDQFPETIRTVRPVYPELAKQAGVEGDVVVDILVWKDGTIRRVEVFKSVLMLDGAAIDAVKQWTFQPALTKGHPVSVWVRVPIKFRLH